MAELRQIGITTNRVRDETAKDNASDKVRGSFQRVARTMIKKKLEPYNEEHRIRHKIKRWKLEGPPAHIAARIARHFQIIGRSCRPCVLAMFFRTIWNGWPTTARMRTAAGASKTSGCVFGCEGCEDRIEHYIVCQIPWTVLPGIGLCAEWKSKQFMLAAEKGMEERQLVLIACANYAIARAVHCIRLQGLTECPAKLVRLFAQDALQHARIRPF